MTKKLEAGTKAILRDTASIAQADISHHSKGALPVVLICAVTTPVIFAIAKFADVGTLRAFVYAALLAGPVTLLLIGLRMALCKVFNCNS
ncbi:MAG: hypothetical protein ACJAXK_001814 [Yoonia sp.]|jgi:hypothetical protein